mgnify:CR=1 FL=1
MTLEVRATKARRANFSPSATPGGGWTSWKAVTVSAGGGLAAVYSEEPSKERSGVNPVSARNWLVTREDGGAARVIVSQRQGTSRPA